MSYIIDAPTGRKALDADEARRLTNVLNRLASNHDGEVLAAATVATGFLKQRDLRWDDVIAPPARASTPTRATISELRPLPLASDRLSTKERIFVRALRDHWELTPKQKAWLDDIIAKVAK